MSEKLKHKHDKLPLLDEVNELIEKERILLNLKLLEQKTETEEWKNKYDLLINTIGNNGKIDTASKIDLFNFEIAAEIESDINEFEHISLHDLHNLLNESVSGWVLDLKDLKIEKILFAKLSKIVFGVNSGFQQINTAIFKNSGLTDEYTAYLLSIIRCIRLKAIDLSNNDLSEIFFLQLLSLLKDRRVTPQYILLEGNLLLSKTVRQFASILDTLTEQTWGVTISLQDLSDNFLSTSKLNKIKSGSKRELNLDYKEISKQPFRALEFLKVFNTRLNPQDANSKSNKSRNSADFKRMLIGRTNGLHRMCVFGLKYCMLSKKTIHILEDTLHYTAASLTDLDLSFSYIGYHGAEMLKNVILSPSCQLIRLGLIGNAIGDLGIRLLGKSFIMNKTLTYLDIRSNNISNVGLRTLFEPLSTNKVLFVLDLRGNCIEKSISWELQNRLYNSGSILEIRTNYADQVQVVDSEKDRMMGSILHEYPEKVRRVGVIDRCIKLYSIDLTTINTNHSDKYGNPISIKWLCRPCPIGTYSCMSSILSNSSSIKSILTTKSLSDATKDATSDYSAYLQLGNNWISYWEVRVSYNHQDLYVKREPFLPSSLISRRLLETNVEWIPCSIVLNDLPLKGTIDISIICEDLSNKKLQNKVLHYLAFEGINLQLNHLPKLDKYYIGGDNSIFNSELGTVISKYEVEVKFENHPLLKSIGLKVLRKIRLTQDIEDFMLSWKSKLISYQHNEMNALKGSKSLMQSAKLGLNSSISIDMLPSNASVLGYEWSVFLFGTEGSCKELSRGVCISSHMNEDFNEAETGENVHTKLYAWSWKIFSIKISNIHINDVIIIAGKPISKQRNYPKDILNQCSVALKSCMLMLHNKPRDINTEKTLSQAKYPTLIASNIDVDDAILNCIHDDCSFSIPL